MRTNNTKFKFSKLYFLVMLFIMFGSSVYLFSQYMIFKAYDDYTNQISIQIQEEECLNEELKIQSEYKESDEYIEKIARDKLGMVKSNEIIFYDLNK